MPNVIMISEEAYDRVRALLLADWPEEAHCEELEHAIDCKILRAGLAPPDGFVDVLPAGRAANVVSLR